MSQSESLDIATQISRGNAAWQANFGDKGKLPVAPTKHVAILTCMDARLDTMQMFGFAAGEAHQIRNGGGRAVEAIRSLVCSQELLGTREIHVIHHTDCGFTHFQTPDLKEKLKSRKTSTPAHRAMIDSLAGLEFSDPAVSVVEDVEFLRGHPLILEETNVVGWKYETTTGKLDKIC